MSQTNRKLQGQANLRRIFRTWRRRQQLSPKLLYLLPTDLV